MAHAEISQSVKNIVCSRNILIFFLFDPFKILFFTFLRLYGHQESQDFSVSSL